MLYIASDHAGYKLKEELVNQLKNLNVEVVDLGPFIEDKGDDYPDFAYVLSKKVAQENAKGILICKSGIGMSIAANKVKGVYAALCKNTQDAISAKEHNHSNVLVLDDNDEIVIEVYEKIVKPWLDTEFSNEERHLRRIEKIKAIEEISMK